MNAARPSFSLTTDTAALPAACSVTPSSMSDGQCGPKQGVGEVRQAEDELDRVIKELGDKAVHARAAGDKPKARDLIDRMYAAMASRSPEHQDRLQREAMARAMRVLDDGVDYFQAQGRAAGERVGGNA